MAVMSMCVASPVSDAYKRGFEMGYSAQTRKPSEAPSNAPSASPTTGTPTRESEAPSNAPSTAPATATAPTEKQSTKPEISVTPSAKRASQSLPTGKAPSSQKECDKRGAFLFESWKLAGKLKCPTGFSITKGTAVNKHIYKHGVCTSIRSMVCQCSASPNGCPRAKCKEYKIEQDPKTLLVTGYGVTGSALRLFFMQSHTRSHMDKIEKQSSNSSTATTKPASRSERKHWKPAKSLLKKSRQLRILQRTAGSSWAERESK